MKYPFIYITSLIRSGSSILMEALTKPNYSYIFGEPWFGNNMFENVKMYAEELEQYGIDVADILRDKPVFFSGGFKRKKTALEVFATELVPLLDAKGLQMGVKEVRGYGWEQYPNYFHDVRFVLLGRDPRDIYLACNSLLKRSEAWKPWFPPFSPKGLFTEVFPTFAMQVKISKTQNSMKIIYEDLCMDSKLFDKIKDFVGSPIPGMGGIGEGHPTVDSKTGYSQDGVFKGLTARGVGRWKREKDKDLVKQAQEFFGLMREYCEFWGYK